MTLGLLPFPTFWAVEPPGTQGIDLMCHSYTLKFDFWPLLYYNNWNRWNWWKGNLPAFTTILNLYQNLIALGVFADKLLAD